MLQEKGHIELEDITEYIHTLVVSYSGYILDHKFQWAHDTLNCEALNCEVVTSVVR